MKTTRNYQGKDVDMLTACATIIENAINNQEFLTSKRKNWEAPFFQDIKSRIEKAFSDFLGINSATELRQTTLALTQIQTQALDDLAELKIQIQEDFKAEKSTLNEILKQLGYTDFYQPARNKDQEALIQLLYRFKSNLSPAFRTQIIEKGTDSAILDRLITYADKLASLNISQESLKSVRKSITENALVEFNQIYDEVISIAKIAQNFYKADTAMQDQFSYSKIKNKLNVAPKLDKKEQAQS